MALDQSVLSELLSAFQSGEGLDLIRESVRLVCQELIETELNAVIGAERYERNAERSAERNGHRARVLTTKADDVELAIPKSLSPPGSPRTAAGRSWASRSATPKTRPFGASSCAP
jgi:transposase-like protein